MTSRHSVLMSTPYTIHAKMRKHITTSTRELCINSAYLSDVLGSSFTSTSLNNLLNTSFNFPNRTNVPPYILWDRKLHISLLCSIVQYIGNGLSPFHNPSITTLVRSVSYFLKRPASPQRMHSTSNICLSNEMLCPTISDTLCLCKALRKLNNATLMGTPLAMDFSRVIP